MNHAILQVCESHQEAQKTRFFVSRVSPPVQSTSPVHQSRPVIVDGREETSQTCSTKAPDMILHISLVCHAQNYTRGLGIPGLSTLDCCTT